VPNLIAHAVAQINKLEEEQRAVRMRETAAGNAARKQPPEAEQRALRARGMPAGNEVRQFRPTPQPAPVPVPPRKRRWLKRLVLAVCVLLLLGGVVAVAGVVAYLAYLDSRPSRASESQPLSTTTNTNYAEPASSPGAEPSSGSLNEESPTPFPTETNKASEAASSAAAPTVAPHATNARTGTITLPAGTGFLFQTEERTSGPNAPRDIWWNGSGLVPHSRMYLYGTISNLSEISVVYPKGVMKDEFAVSVGQGFVIELSADEDFSYAVIRVLSVEEGGSITFEWLYPFNGPQRELP
jgi:hypothetical protein